MRRVFKIMLAAAALGPGMAAPVGATVNVAVAGSTNLCDTAPSDTTPSATACAGYFAGNILDNSPADMATISAALSALGVSYSGNISNYVGGVYTGSTSLAAFLGSPGGLTGTQVIGIHWGNGSANDDPTVGNSTAFYKIDFDSTPTPLSLNLRGVSNAYIFTSGAVPEPATWGMMLLGFAGIGLAMRRNRRKPNVLMQIA